MAEKKNGKTQLTNTTNETGYDITTDATDIKMIIEYEQLYANKFYNVDEMDKFFDRHTLLQLTQDKIDSLNSLKTITEIIFMVNNLSTKTTLGPDGLLDILLHI